MTAKDRPCSENELALHALADGELDAAHALALESHLETCPRCQAAFEAIQNHKNLLRSADLKFKAPSALAQVLPAALTFDGKNPVRGLWPTRSDRPAGRYRATHYLGLVSSLAALAASLILVVFWSWSEPRGIDNEIVDNHVRSLLASHLTDVASNDQHTVKPWFAGKLDYSPPVHDLSAQGFPLVGGRLDYVGGRVVAALVYKRHDHIINLFIWPKREAAAHSSRKDGFNVVAWSSPAFEFALVSDLNATELNELAKALGRQA